MSDDSDNKDDKARSGVLEAREELHQLFKRGAEFTEELLKENEALRFRVAELEAREGGGGDDEGLVKELIAKVKRLEEERDAMKARFGEIEANSQHYISRFAEIERHNNDLLNTYVATHQLTNVFEFDGVLRVVAEIILNLIGAERFAIALADPDSNTLRPLIAEGCDPDVVAGLSTKQGIVAEVLESGQMSRRDDVTSHRGLVDLLTS